MNIAFYTLGCKVNQYESAAIIEKCIEKGHKIVDFGEKADAYIINTCSVTAVSDKKSRQIIHRARKENPGAVIAVMGCYSQTNPKALEQDGSADIILGTSDRMAVVDYIENYKNKKITSVKNIFDIKSFENMDTASFYEKTRATIKIEDGCQNFCTYCIIPYARGPVRSKSLSDLRKEAVKIAEKGYKEVVLTGIHLDSYGKDLENTSLLDAVGVCEEISGIERIRLGSLEPVIITEEFLERAAGFKKLCPHFHLSLQSGCDETLKRMNRHYSCEDYERCVDLIRKYYDMPAITTDIMVGFAGETEQEFCKSLAFAEKIGFAQAHIFPYSRREGTKAYSMPCQNTNKTKQERVARMIEVTLRTRKRFFDENIGRCERVLLERKTAGYWEGFTENYIPVKLRSEKNLENKIVTAVLTENMNEFMYSKEKDDEKGI